MIEPLFCGTKHPTKFPPRFACRRLENSPTTFSAVCRGKEIDLQDKSEKAPAT